MHQQSALWIRNRMDQHQTEKKAAVRIRVNALSWIRIPIRIKVISWIRIPINLQMTSQNVWEMSLFEHFFKILRTYLEARIWIHIKVKR